MNRVDYNAAREAMVVSQLRTNSVSDPRLLEAFRAVPREHYVPEARAQLAYTDNAVPLPNGRALNAPLTTARLIGEARIAAGDKVLVLASATEYTAALVTHLGAIVATAATVEEAASQAPYDVIIIDGAVEILPESLVEMLNVGGRLSCGLNENGVSRLALGQRSAGGFGLVTFADMDCVTVPGFAKERAFSF